MEVYDNKGIIQAFPKGRPHLILLGAGASRAACPHGDANGQQLPVMADLISLLGLESQLKEAGLIGPFADFELLYSTLFDNGNHDLLETLDAAIYDYFSQLELPPNPGLYDHLMLSLRKKDVLATFNWDPFIVQAWVRCRKLTEELPHLITLHGNVGQGVCTKHEKVVVTPRDLPCPRCGEPTERSKLLFPIAHKDYSSDPDIAACWTDIQTALKSAYVFTIFGYAAPKSDEEAKKLMSAAWGRSAAREYEEIEIINILSKDELNRTWDDFICASHFRTTESFYQSIAGQYPRRGCEMVWEQTMEMRLWEPYRSPEGLGWDDLQAWLEPLLVDEVQQEAAAASEATAAPTP